MKFIDERSFGIIPLKKEDDDWKVLLILHKIGEHWGFPKGKGLPGEEAIDSAIRELKEETGLDVTNFLSEEPMVEQYQFRKRGDIVSKTVLFYPAFVTGKLVIQPEEIREAKWVKLKEADLFLSFKEAKNICHQLLVTLERA